MQEKKIKDKSENLKIRNIGVISDTHGLLRFEAVEALHGSDLIIHAGDVGAKDILERLGRIAPVIAVRGNVDQSIWARALPMTEVVETSGKYLYILHDLSQFDLDPIEAEIHCVISGHTHNPLIEERNGVLYLNPGSAGPRRFTLPVTLARIEITKRGLESEMIRFAV